MSSVRAAILFAVEAFYQAFNDRDFAAMAALWDEDGPVSCIHPGWHPLSGRQEVLATWKAILGNAESPTAEMVAAKVQVLSPDVALVVGFERIGNQHLAVTNTLVRRNGRWLVAHHQAGPLAMQPEFEEEGEEPAAGPTLN